MLIISYNRGINKTHQKQHYQAKIIRMVVQGKLVEPAVYFSDL